MSIAPGWRAPLPSTLTVHRLLTSAVWSHTAGVSLHGPLSAWSQGSWWRAGPRCAARGTARVLKTPSELAGARAQLPPNCLRALTGGRKPGLEARAVSHYPPSPAHMLLCSHYLVTSTVSSHMAVVRSPRRGSWCCKAITQLWDFSPGTLLSLPLTTPC